MRIDQEIANYFDKNLLLSDDSIKKYINVAGCKIELEFCHSKLEEEFFFTLAHNEIFENEDPDFKIIVTTEIPKGLFANINIELKKQFHKSEIAPIYFYKSDKYLITCNFELNGDVSLIYYYNIDNKTAYVWANVDLIEKDEFGGIANTASFRTIFSWVLSEKNLFLIHAGGVGLENGGLILPGKSGCGKSSTSSICANNNLLMAGDDTVVISNDSEPMVYSLYCVARIFPEDFKYYPKFTSSFALRSDIKKGINFAKTDQNLLIKKFPLKAIVFPEKTKNTHQKYFPISKIEALRRMTASSFYIFPRKNNQFEFNAFSQILDKVPCFVLELGSDRNSIPSTIEEILLKVS